MHITNCVTFIQGSNLHGKKINHLSTAPRPLKLKTNIASIKKHLFNPGYFVYLDRPPFLDW